MKDSSKIYWEDINNLFILTNSKILDAIRYQKDLKSIVEYLFAVKLAISKVFKNLYNMYKFQEECCCKAMENLSPEEYDKVNKEIQKIQEKFAISIVDLEDDEIAAAAKIILGELDMSLSTADIADLMHTDVLRTEEALQKYSKKDSVEEEDE